MSDEQPELIEQLLEEFVERLRQGQTPSIAEYAARCPAHTDQIEEYLAAAQMMEQRAQRRQFETGEGIAFSRLGERLGDYRIIREIGRGGMGIVYEAQQESLGRRVAVKVLPQSSLLKPEALRRFEREARTAARLHHSNIIPVFGVGEDQGFHYIVMQLIQGVGLDKILDQLRRVCNAEAPSRSDLAAETADHSSTVARALLQGEFSQAKPSAGSLIARTEALQQPAGADPSAGAEAVQAVAPVALALPIELGAHYWQSVARIGLQAARALEYAHRRGTFHRDIKPANLLIDLQGVVWVGDFGLAKAQEHDEASRTGEIAGTLRYMAPERFHGHVDARSDIYGLGLSLYEMLTLRPAYDNLPPSALIQQITTQSPPPPRSLNRRIPADLETIVQKAIAKEPAHRYSSVQDLADDLERFLDDRPIRARRVGLVERLWRWSRRNRDVAALAGLAVVLFVVVILVMSVGYVRTTIANRQVLEALDGESRQRQIAEAQQRKAEAVTELTTAALDDIFEQFVPGSDRQVVDASALGPLDGQVRLPVQPEVSKEVATLLERMLPFYDRLAQQEAEDNRVRRKVADANRRVGDIRRRLSQLDQAQTAYLRAIDLYGPLLRESPEDNSIALEIARINNDVGSLHWMARWQGEGRAYHRKAMTILSAMDRSAAALPQSRFERAKTHYFLGRGSPPDAVPGRQPSEDAPGGSPKQRDDRPRDGVVREDRQPAPSPPQRGNPQDLQNAINVLEGLIADCPKIPAYRHLLACCYRELPQGAADSELQSSDKPGKAVELLEKLVEDFPEAADFRYDLSKAYAKVDPRDPRLADDHFTAAEQRLRLAIRILDRLIAENPQVPDYCVAQVQSLYTLSEILRRSRRPDDGQASLRTALARQTALVDQFPKITPYRAWKAILQESLAKLLSNRGQTEEARGLLEAAIADLEGSLKAEPEARYLSGLIGRCYANLADLLTIMGQQQKAAEFLERGRKYSSGR